MTVINEYRKNREHIVDRDCHVELPKKFSNRRVLVISVRTNRFYNTRRVASLLCYRRHLVLARIPLYTYLIHNTQ